MRVKVWTRYDLPIIMAVSFAMMLIGVYTRDLWYCGGGLIIYLTTLIAEAELKTSGEWRKKHD